MGGIVEHLEKTLGRPLKIKRHGTIMITASKVPGSWVIQFPSGRREIFKGSQEEAQAKVAKFFKGCPLHGADIGIGITEIH